MTGVQSYRSSLRVSDPVCLDSGETDTAPKIIGEEIKSMSSQYLDVTDGRLA